MVMTRKLNEICMWLFSIFGVVMIIADMRRNHLEEFFSYFSLASEQKCCVQMKLVGEAYW